MDLVVRVEDIDQQRRNHCRNILSKYRIFPLRLRLSASPYGIKRSLLTFAKTSFILLSIVVGLISISTRNTFEMQRFAFTSHLRQQHGRSLMSKSTTKNQLRYSLLHHGTRYGLTTNRRQQQRVKAEPPLLYPQFSRSWPGTPVCCHFHRTGRHCDVGVRAVSREYGNSSLKARFRNSGAGDYRGNSMSSSSSSQPSDGDLASFHRVLGGSRVVGAHVSHKISTLVLIRHGESEWNRASDERFTGWFDVPLSAKGKHEASEAGRMLHERGILDLVEVAFTSKLKRSYETLDLMLANTTANFSAIRSWRLNERHYGALQGYNKETIVESFYDKESVRKWRRSWDVPPPKMPDNHPHYSVVREQYSREEIEEMGGDIPRGESLEQCAQRLLPFWNEYIMPHVKEGKCILVVAHANSLRSLIGTVFDVSKAEIEKLRIPTGSPLVYNLDSMTGKPLPVPEECSMLEGELLWPIEECPVLFDEYYSLSVQRNLKKYSHSDEDVPGNVDEKEDVKR